MSTTDFAPERRGGRASGQRRALRLHRPYSPKPGIRTVLACTVAALLACATGARAALSAPKGNSQAIAFQRAAATVYRRVPGLTYTVTNFVSMQSLLGQQSSFAWAWGFGYVPSGYTKATERITVRLRNGRIVWGEDDLIPSCLHSPAGCVDMPVRVVVDRAGAFWAFNDPRAPASVTCFGRLRSNKTPIGRIGQAWINGPHGIDYLPLVRRGDMVLLRYSYAWGASQRAIETDTYTAAKRITAYEVSVSRGVASNEPAFRVFARVVTLTNAPVLPKLRLCG